MDINQEIKEKNQELKLLKEEMDIIKSDLNRSKLELNLIYSSRSWKIVLTIRRILSKLIPIGTYRRKLVISLWKLFKLIYKKIRQFLKIKNNNDYIEQVLGLSSFNIKKINFKKYDKPIVSIIIPIYNKWQFTYNCLQAILKNTNNINYEVIIVDNGSTDETNLLIEKVDNIIYLKNEKNLGFAKACNQGAKIAQGEYLLFLNNDTVALPLWLNVLIDELKQNSNTGIVGSKLIYPDKTIQHAGVIFSNKGEPYHIHNKKHNLNKEANKKKRFLAITGACLAIKRNLFKQVEGFDEIYKNSYEDIDLCLKVASLGFSIVYCPESCLYHYESMSHGRFDNDHSNFQRFKTKWLDKTILKNEIALFGSEILEEPIESKVIKYPKHKLSKQGVNLFGYYNYQFGLSKIIHSFENIFSLIKINSTINNLIVGGHKEYKTNKKNTYNKEYLINIISINPDNCHALFEQYPYDIYFKRKYNIAYWIYETKGIPVEFFTYAPLFDEIWTASNFAKEILLPLNKKVRVLPILGNFEKNNEIAIIPQIQKIIDEKKDEKKFLFMFDFFSCPYRKNIFQLIDIFKDILLTGRKFKLFLKIKNAPESFIENLKKLIANLPIYILTKELKQEELHYLYNSVDYYVSLHSSEGYGLTILEAIYYKVMPIVTAYGGVMDFCNEKNSILVDYDMIDIPVESFYHNQGQWAQPKKEDAITKICLVIDNPIIQKPNQEIFNQISEKVLSQKVFEYLNEIKN